ncbi:MAG: teicoplanin resistance protein VanZ [candidate division Zixibacteria bacterium]|nr:teicoplanin resistance protein VanZ [candidate division Zixibacteria bacterium]
MRFIYIYLPAIAYSTLIIYVSSLPQIKTPPVGFDPGDKVLHMIAYFIFGILWYRAFSAAEVDRRYPIINVLVLYGFSFAALDELHQYFVPNREMDFWDFAADVTGIILAIVAFKLWADFRSKKAAKKNSDNC